MNFFAHAVLAAERDTRLAFVLGAMLPDLCELGGVPLAGAPASALGEGVRFHHAGDAAFHAQPIFASRCGALVRALEASGVRRGPARGAAHVATELLLDGWLASEHGVPNAYRDALADAGALLRDGALANRDDDSLALVCARIHASPLPLAYAQASFVCERVERALATRPVLALAASELPALERALDVASRACARWAPELLASVRTTLNEPRKEAQ